MLCLCLINQSFLLEVNVWTGRLQLSFPLGLIELSELRFLGRDWAACCFDLFFYFHCSVDTCPSFNEHKVSRNS